MTTHHTSTPPTPSDLLAVAVEAAQAGGEEICRQRHTRSVAVSFKGTRDLLTTADLAAEKIVIQTIRSHHPLHAILAEESSHTADTSQFGTGAVWVIDPIDGTTNYAHGHHQVGVSIACVIDGKTVAGAVLAPFLGELFTAYSGGGAFLNGTPISVSPTNRLDAALIATGFPYDRSNVPNICKRLQALLSRCRDIRRLGAASLDICWVACGRLDAYYEETLNSWDGAAGCLIAREAGARIGHYPYDSPTQRRTDGYPGDLFMDNLIVSCPGVFDELSKELENAARTK
jgi:myo-inositol-1(or 4)-monophosphatase